MVAGEEIDLTKLGEQIEYISKEIQKLNSGLSTSEKRAKDIGDVDLAGKLKGFGTAISNMENSVYKMRESMKGSKGDIVGFLDELVKMKNSLSSAKTFGALPITGLMESLAKLDGMYRQLNKTFVESTKDSEKEIGGMIRLWTTFPKTMRSTVLHSENQAKYQKETADRAKETAQYLDTQDKLEAKLLEKEKQRAETQAAIMRSILSGTAPLTEKGQQQKEREDFMRQERMKRALENEQEIVRLSEKISAKESERREKAYKSYIEGLEKNYETEELRERKHRIIEQNKTRWSKQQAEEQITEVEAAQKSIKYANERIALLREELALAQSKEQKEREEIEKTIAYYKKKQEEVQKSLMMAQYEPTSGFKIDSLQKDFEEYGQLIQKEQQKLSDFGVKAIQEEIAANEKIISKENEKILQNEAKRIDAENKIKDAKSAELKITQELEKRQKLLNDVAKGKSSAIASYLKQEMSIKRMNNALNGLRAAQENCNLATEQGRKKYQQIDAEIKQIEKTILRVNGEQNVLNGRISKMKNVLGQIAMSFGLMTGIFGATNFFRSLYRITAEFQLQQKALGAIVQNVYEANILFKRMQSLAVESPMKLLNLNKYAKQLAAFRIETQELYDTLKMLGDISVGVGVDMDRLILAYGQVKAANYLRGQELRQFSEAGVNILGGLQEYYLETKNINMSINEIFDSVSKRKVLFEDVDAVLKRMTESGGTFYNMQLIQSQTLYGQLQKLGDIFQIQMNDIGKSTSGILLLMIKLVQTLVSNLKLVVAVVGTFATYAGVRKLVLDLQKGTLVSKDFKLMLEACRVQASLLSKAGWKELISNIRGATAASASLKANLVGLGVGLAVLAGSAIFGAIQKRNQKLDEAADRLTEIRKRAYAIQELEKQFRSRPAYKERLALLQQLDEKAKEFGYHLRIAEDVTPQNISRVWAEALKNFNDYNDRVANYESAIANRPAIERNIKDLARITGVQALAYEEARRDYEFFTMNADKLTTAAKEELNKITKIKQDFIKNEREATLEYGYTSKQFETVFAESMLNIRRNIQGIGGGLAAEFEKERGSFDGYLKKFFKGGFFGENDYKSELADVKKKLKKAAEDLGLVDSFVGTEDEIKQKIEATYPAWKSALKGIPDIIKPELPNIFAEITGAIPKIVLDVDYQLDHSESDLQDKEWVKDYRKFMKESGFEYDESQDAYVVDAKVDVVYGNYNDPLQAKDLDKDVTVIKRALTDLNVSGQENMDDFKKRLTDRKKRLEEFIEKYTKQVALIKFINKEFGEGIDFSDYEAGIASLKAELEIVDDVIKKVFGGLQSSSSGRAKSMKSEYQSMIDFVRELNREFDTLRKNFNEKDSARWVGATNRILSSFEAKFGAMPAKFRKAFQDSLASIDFTTKKGTVNAENIVKGLIDSAKDLTKKEKSELQRAWGEAVGQIKLEAELELKAREDERLKTQVQKMFDDYNLTIELDKLGVDADEVGKLFNIDTKDLLTLERKLESMKEEFVGRQMEKEYRQFMRKIVEINDKANLEMAKKYVKYLREEYGERAKVELEYMRQRAEVYALPFDEDETMRILDNLQKETKKKLDEIDWKTFTGSDTYIELFEDLSKASVRSMDYMIDQLKVLKSSLSSLDPSNLKTIVDQIEKLEDELIKRDPFKVLSDSMKSWRDFRKDEKTTSLINEILGNDSDAKIKDFRNTLNKAIEEAKKKVDEARNKVNLQNALFGAAKQRDEAANWAVENIEGINWDNVYNLGGMQRALKEIEEERDKLSKRINAQKLIGVTSEEGLSGDEKLYLKYSKYAEYISKVVSALEALQKTGDKYTSASDLEKAWKDANGDLEQFLKNLKELESGKRSFDKIGEAAIEAGKQLADMATNMKNAYTSINEYLDSIGVATGKVGEAWKEFGSTMFDTIIQALQMIPAMVASIVSAETAINAAAGWIGLIAEAITIVMGLAKSLAGLHDAYKQEEIDKLQKSLDKLEKTANDLDEAFDDLFDEDRLRAFDAALIKTRELEIATLEAMMAAEKAKKKSDQTVIDGYQDQIDSLTDDIHDGIDKFYEALGGFGSAANMKSMAESWTDAWYDAFKETGDGLSGLEDSFEEFFENIVKKTLMNNIMTKYFGEDFLSGLDKILGTEGGVMGNLDALNDWITQYHDLAVQADEEMQSAVNAIQSVTGIGGGLEGLQASLQGMTEETADILAAYLNSVRFYVADNNQLLQNLLNGLTIDNNSNPMLQQLKIVAAQTTSINLLLDSVVHSGGYQGNGGGSYLKVHAILES